MPKIALKQTFLVIKSASKPIRVGGYSYGFDSKQEYAGTTAPDKEWADMIFVMEKVHKTRLSAQFRSQLSGHRVVVLGIADNYKFMDEALVRLLERKVTPYLPVGHNAP